MSFPILGDADRKVSKLYVCDRAAKRYRELRPCLRMTPQPNE